MKGMCIAGLLSMAMALPASVQGQAKPKGELVDAEKALTPGQVTGKVVSATESAMLLRVEFPRYELNEQALRNLQRGGGNTRQVQDAVRRQREMAQMQQRLARARSPQEQMKIMQDLKRRMAQQQLQALQKLRQQQGRGGQGQQLYKVVNDSKDFNIELDDNVQFRTSFVPFVYDDMGNPKKFTAQELAELKGRTNLPGYKAGAADVRSGQVVTVTLSKNRETENKLRGTVVLIVKESDAPLKPERGKK